MSSPEPPRPVRVTTGTLRDWPLPEPGSDKEARGRVLVVGGSQQTPGAVLLAGEAALRVGAGKLQVATAGSAAAPLAVALPEAAVLPLPERGDGVIEADAANRVVEAARGASAVLVGPGLLDVDAAVGLGEAFLPRLESSTVVDALATAFVTAHPRGLAHLAGRCVVNANPTELALILDRDVDEVTADETAQLAATEEVAVRSGVVVLCGGTRKTVVAPDGRCWLVSAGGTGLGVSGSGDVQAGIVAGLLARGADPAQAAVWGAWLHGTAGDRLAVEVGPVGFLARELPARLPGLLAGLAAQA